MHYWRRGPGLSRPPRLFRSRPRRADSSEKTVGGVTTSFAPWCLAYFALGPCLPSSAPDSWKLSGHEPPRRPIDHHGENDRCCRKKIFGGSLSNIDSK